LIKTDESKEQDDKVFEHQKLEEGYGIKEIPGEMKTVKAMFHILEGEEDEVFVPYVDSIQWGFKHNRRDFPLFMSLLKSSTKLFKFQRQRLDDERLIANRIDFEIAKHIWIKNSELQSKKISQEDQRILAILPTESHNAITRANITDTLGWSTGKIQQHLDYGLCTAEKNLVAKDKNEDRRVVYWKLIHSNLLQLIIQVDWSAFDIKKLKATITPTYWKNRSEKELYSILSHPNNFNKYLSSCFNYTTDEADGVFSYIISDNKQSDQIKKKGEKRKQIPKKKKNYNLDRQIKKIAKSRGKKK